MKTDRLQIRTDYIEERDKPYRNETEGKINYTKDYVKWLEDKLVNNINYTNCCKSDSELLVCDDNELDCPYEFTSRCTMGRCGCKPKAN
jgi:hypothetical protein